MMNNKQKQLLAAFCVATTPTIKQDIVDWVPDNVRLSKSQYSNVASITDYTPWFIDPARSATSPDYDEINIVAGTGAGKSTLLEMLISYSVTNDSGDILYITQNNDTAATFTRDRLTPTLKRTLSTKALMDSISPKQITKDFINLPHMKITTGGANMSNLQELSMQKVLLDECWNWNQQNLIGEARKRLHDRDDGKLIAVSQAGSKTGKGSEWYNTAKSGQMMVYNWRCDCGVHNDWGNFENIKFDKVLTADESEIDFIKTYKTVHLQCPTCQKKYIDEPMTRHKLARESIYVDQGNNHQPNRITYLVSSIAIPKIKWSKVVGEFLQAEGELNKGNIHPLLQFKNKICSEFTELESQDIEIDELILSDYVMADVVDPPTSGKRIMTCDVQGGGKSDQYYWGVIRDWDNGKSKLVWEGMIKDKAQINEIATRYKVNPKRVFLDCAYETQIVMEACAKYGWHGLDGRNADSYKHKTGDKIHSRPRMFSHAGKRTASYVYAAEKAKDVLQALKTGAGAEWLLPQDVSKTYKRHLAAEVKQLQSNGTWHWQCIDKDHNHMFDCEVMQIVAAMILGVY